MSNKELHWDWEISSKTTWIGSSLKELYAYKDLLLRLVRERYFNAAPAKIAWSSLGIITTIVNGFYFVLVFNIVLKVHTGGIPSFIVLFIRHYIMESFFRSIIGYSRHLY